jgi:hypothetical protein
VVRDRRGGEEREKNGAGDRACSVSTSLFGLAPFRRYAHSVAALAGLHLFSLHVACTKLRMLLCSVVLHERLLPLFNIRVM